MSGAWEGALVCSSPGSGGAHPLQLLKRWGALPRPQSCCLRRGEVWGGGLANAEGQLPGASKGFIEREDGLHGGATLGRSQGEGGDSLGKEVVRTRRSYG